MQILLEHENPEVAKKAARLFADTKPDIPIKLTSTQKNGTTVFQVVPRQELPRDHYASVRGWMQGYLQARDDFFSEPSSTEG